MSNSKAIVVEICEGDPIDPARTWTNPDTGEVKPIPASQTGYLWGEGRYPEANIKVPFDDKAGPLRPGFYLLAAGSLKVSMAKATKGQVVFDSYNVQLVPVADAMKQLTELAPKLKAAS